VAAGLGIDLLFIPPGMTDQLQPLDCSVFGALKSICRKLFDPYSADNAMADLRQIFGRSVPDGGMGTNHRRRFPAGVDGLDRRS
jgi:hypothetical protein